MKHKADGLYYFDLSILSDLSMCYMARAELERILQEHNGRVPVTLANVRAADRNGSWINPYAIAERLYDRGKITFSDFNKIFNSSYNTCAVTLMNALYRRAKRERLI